MSGCGGKIVFAVLVSALFQLADIEGHSGKSRVSESFCDFPTKITTQAYPNSLTKGVAKRGGHDSFKRGPACNVVQTSIFQSIVRFSF